jgi:hypothetical protein
MESPLLGAIGETPGLGAARGGNANGLGTRTMSVALLGTISFQTDGTAVFKRQRGIGLLLLY